MGLLLIYYGITMTLCDYCGLIIDLLRLLWDVFVDRHKPSTSCFTCLVFSPEAMMHAGKTAAIYIYDVDDVITKLK